MCGRYTLYSNKDTIENHFEVALEDESLIRPSYNIAPGSLSPVIFTMGTRERRMDFFRWGFIPSFTDQAGDWKPLINARSETVDSKPSFRKAFQRKRCILPANGFYEWKDFGDGRKIPFYIRLLEEEIFGMAGIYDEHTDKNGTKISTFAILTTSANALIQPLHERMPVILRKDDYNLWLNPVHPKPETLKALLSTCPVEKMATFKVGTAANNPRNDHPDLIKPSMK